MSVENIPNYAAKVPFQLVLNDNTSHAMEFIAGFANVLNEKGRFRPQLTAAIASNDSEMKFMFMTKKLNKKNKKIRKGSKKFLGAKRTK